MEEIFIDPVYWSADTIAALSPDVIHELAMKASKATSACRLVTGRCLLAIDRNKMYLEMGYSGAIHYGVQVLRQKKKEARMLRRVALRLESLPRLTKAAELNQISWTSLRSVVTKATFDTEEFWLEIASRKGCDEIESLATATEFGKLPWDGTTAVAPPTTKLQLNLSEETGELLSRVTQNLSQELGKPLSTSEVLEHLAIEKLAKRPLTPQVVEATRKEARRGCAAARRRHAKLIEEARQVALDCGLGSDSHELMAAALGTENPFVFADDRPACAAAEELILPTPGEADLPTDCTDFESGNVVCPGRDAQVFVDTPDTAGVIDANPGVAGANSFREMERDRPGRGDGVEIDARNAAVAVDTKPRDARLHLVGVNSSREIELEHSNRDTRAEAGTQHAAAAINAKPLDAEFDFLSAASSPGLERERPARVIHVEELARETTAGRDLYRNHADCNHLGYNHADCRPKAGRSRGQGWDEGSIVIDLVEAPFEQSGLNPAAVLSGGDLDRLLASAKLPPDTDPRTVALIDMAIREKRVVVDLDDESWKNPRVRFNPDARFVTPAQRKELLRRDGYCCRTPGCPNHLWIDMHHVVYVSNNGKTLTLNLVSLCWRCHRNVHDGFLSIEGDADRGLIFRDAKGRDLELAYQTEFASWLNLHIGWSGGRDDFHRPRLFRAS